MKKILLMTSLLLLFSFNSVVFAYEYNGEPLETNSKPGDSFLGVQEVENILDTLGVTYSGGNELLAYTYYINDTFDYYREFYSDNTISNLNFLFYTNNAKTNITVVPGNGTFSNSLRYNYINVNDRLLTTVKEGTNPTVGNPPTTQPTQFTSLNQNGIIQQATTTLYLPTSTEFLITENNLSVSTLVAPIGTFSVYGGPPYAYYFISSTFKFFGDIEIPDNPEDPDNPGSGESGNVDLSGIQTGINNINQNLNNIENKIPSSGDIAQSTQTGFVSGNKEFWGSSGDLSGDEQEELISGKIDELTNTLSGDLAENEIFGILQTYEDKLFGGFTGEEDFVISWNDINYNGQRLIPSGEVNFSKICRENEALGNVKSTINIILTFIILMNIVIYMYNLLLATLGIDNPYLYEKPVGSVTTSEYTDESGRIYVTRTQHDGRGNSISKKYNHTVEPRKRQIGFRKW